MNSIDTLPNAPSKLRDWRLSTRKVKRAGNAARDSGDWTAASKLYRRYLDLVSDDVAIWVQYGHALKESGLFAEAESAYRRALILAPDDVETMVHLAHLLKRMKQPDKAKELFVDILELKPSPEIFQDLKEVVDLYPSHSVLQTRPARALRGGVYFELKDLFVYLSQHTTVTGITRVTLGIVNYVLDYMDSGKAKNFFFVHQFRDAEGVMLISHDNMRRVLRAALSAEPDLLKMQDTLNLVKATSPTFLLEEGDSYVILGAFWEFVANPSWIGGMRDRGVKIGAYIYDLIPITHQQYCMEALTEAFTVAFAETSRLLDFALTISEFVAAQVTDFLTLHQIAPLPTMAVPLAHELRFEAEAAATRRISVAASSEGTLHIVEKKYLDGVPFVLCVCTIEARKNHAYLFSIWQRMIENSINVPDLVFVGRPGWRVSDLVGQIEESRFLGGRLHILNGLTDEELSGLYDRCLFTVFPSFVEGWGLPVGESLAHGKVCVASSASSIPEVGGEYVIYVDPFDIDSGYAAISKLIRDQAELARAQNTIRNAFVSRTWQDVGRDFFKTLETLLAVGQKNHTRRPSFSPDLRSGQALSVKNMGRIGKRGVAYVRNPDRLVFLAGWRGVESTGTWMLDGTARVRVKTDCLPAEQVVVLLNLGTSPWVGPQNTLEIETVGSALRTGDAKSRARYRRPMRSDEELWLTVQGQVDDSGCLTVQFRVTGLIQTNSPDAIAVGLRFKELSYVRASDVVARLGLLERSFLSPGSVLVSSDRAGF